MTYQDWIFALHLLFAATLVGGVVMSWILILPLRSTGDAAETLSVNRVSMIGTVATLVGLAGTIALGLWLAVLRPEFHPWDGWVIGAIVLWLIATVSVLRSFVEYRKPAEKARQLLAAGGPGTRDELRSLNRTWKGLLLRALASGSIVLIVVDMVYKPGA